MKFLVRHHAERIDDRRDIYPEGDDLGKHDLQIAILGGKRGEDHTESDGHKSQDEDKYRE